MSALIDDLLSLRDGRKDELGRLLLRAVQALRRADRVKRALTNLVRAHDEVPLMLTAEEWKEARAALGYGPMNVKPRNR